MVFLDLLFELFFLDYCKLNCFHIILKNISGKKLSFLLLPYLTAIHCEIPFHNVVILNMQFLSKTLSRLI